MDCRLQECEHVIHCIFIKRQDFRLFGHYLQLVGIEAYRNTPVMEYDEIAEAKTLDRLFLLLFFLFAWTKLFLFLLTEAHTHLFNF